jgi:hypothetical protein
MRQSNKARDVFNCTEDNTMAVITMTQWARITARAWLDPEFKAALEMDPKAALDPAGKFRDVRSEFGIRDDAKLFDVNDPSYGGGTDESGTEPTLIGMPKGDLRKIIMDGVLPKNNHPAKMMASEWVSYPPLRTKPMEHPDGATAGKQGPTLPLKDWARILAYIIFRNDDNLRFLFETNPVEAITTIKTNLETEFSGKIPIAYEHGRTALFRIGDRPTGMEDKELTAIRTDPNTYARMLIRVTC